MLYLLYPTEAKLVDRDTIVEPREATSEDLLVVHTKTYLDSLRVCGYFTLSRWIWSLPFPCHVSLSKNCQSPNSVQQQHEHHH